MNIYIHEYFSYTDVPNHILDLVGSDHATGPSKAQCIFQSFVDPTRFI